METQGPTGDAGATGGSSDVILGAHHMTLALSMLQYYLLAFLTLLNPDPQYFCYLL